MRPGNSCPWIIRKKALDELLIRDGCYFDEQYEYCGGYEDWDLNRRLIDNGHKVLITTKARVKHEGMVSRKKPRKISAYSNAGRANADRYTKKWGDTKCPV